MVHEGPACLPAPKEWAPCRAAAGRCRHQARGALLGARPEVNLFLRHCSCISVRLHAAYQTGGQVHALALAQHTDQGVPAAPQGLHALSLALHTNQGMPRTGPWGLLKTPPHLLALAGRSCKQPSGGMTRAWAGPGAEVTRSKTLRTRSWSSGRWQSCRSTCLPHSSVSAMASS